MQNFCKKCGNKLDAKTGLCPNCDKSKSRKEKKSIKKEYKKALKKEKKAQKWARLTIGQKIQNVCLKILIIILILLLLAGGATTALVYFDVVDIPAINNVLMFFGVKEDEDNSQEDSVEVNRETTSEKPVIEFDDDGMPVTSQYKVDHPDADEYFKNNSQIISETEADKSSSVISEEDASTFFSDRGFTAYPITSEYSIDGEIGESKEITDYSSTVHPIYQTIYLTAGGELWTVFLINDSIMANPVSYNMQSNKDVQVIISENDFVTSYDSVTNKFYKTTPNPSELIVKKIERIDAEALERLNIGAIDAL